MKSFHLLCFLSITFIVSLSLHARAYEGWTVMNYNNGNGLPQNSVKSMEMDNDGFLWFTTEVGIVRFDGQRFRLFDNNNSKLLRNRYTCVGKTPDGRIYCVDDRCWISYYDSQNCFSYPRPMGSTVFSVAGDVLDLGRIDLRVLQPTAHPDSFFRDYIFFPTGNQKGFLTHGLNTVGYITNVKYQWTKTLEQQYGLVTAGTIGGKYCYISQQGDICLVDSTGKQSRVKFPFPVNWEKVRNDVLHLVFFQHQDRLLLSLGGDIYELSLDGEALKFTLLLNSGNIPFVHTVRYFPEKGLLVLGSNTEGLFVFKKKQLATLSIDDKEPESYDALARYGNDQVLTSKGLLSPSGGIANALTFYGRHSILQDRQKHYWFQQYGDLLETDAHLVPLRRVPLKQHAVVSCLQEDEDGKIWVAQRDAQFGWLDGKVVQPYALQGVAGKSIISFIPAGHHTFWLVGNGLCLWLDVKHHQQRIYQQFDSIELRTAYLDKEQNLWLGSYGQGYFLLRNGRVTKMPEDAKHHLQFVHSFVEDKNGFIWMSTNKGLFQTSVKDLYSYADGQTKQVYHQYYGLESGLVKDEFNGGCTPSGIALPNGQFAFPSMAGVVLFHPDSIKPELPQAQFFIEQLLLDGVAVNRNSLSDISPSFSRLEFTVSSPYFGNANNLNIQYNIGGLDERWYALNESGHIVLNRLEYGNYNIRIRKLSGFGANSYIITELPITILPFFYQTWWFHLLVVLAILLVVLIVVKLRYRYLIRAQQRLESEVTERTNALRYNNKLLEKLSLMIAHDLKSPLHFLAKITGHLRTNIRQEKMQEIERTTDELKNTADQLYHFVEEFNLWASSFHEGFTRSNSHFSLHNLLEELQLFFREMSVANGNRLFCTISEDYMLHTDRQLLKVVLRNIIDNANKHAQDAAITINVVAVNDHTIAINVTDTGVGMSPNTLNRIQERIAQAATAASIERNSRLGYQMIIDFAARLDAKLEVKSETGKGTSVTLMLSASRSETITSITSTEQVVSIG